MPRSLGRLFQNMLEFNPNKRNSLSKTVGDQYFDDVRSEVKEAPALRKVDLTFEYLDDTSSASNLLH